MGVDRPANIRVVRKSRITQNPQLSTLIIVDAIFPIAHVRGVRVIVVFLME